MLNERRGVQLRETSKSGTSSVFRHKFKKYGTSSVLTDKSLVGRIQTVGGLKKWDEFSRSGPSSESGPSSVRLDSIKCATVTAMCCGPLLEHLQLNTARLQDFSSLRTEIERYIEGRHGLGDQHGAPGPQPMEVNGLGPPPGRRPAGGKGAPGGAAPPASSGSRVP